ncbi:MAG: LuxR family transcriptional regulator [Propionibacteriaceae bacterium]|jgi:DNA-binding CsgD family transcriptional regulator|nr:LuxR family transcriptional regulator [Propionibacteriaceae bacterium]
MAPSPELAFTRRLQSRIVEDLTSGQSVLLTGLPGSGRSHLVRLVAGELNARRASVTVLRGNPLLSDRPLAALTLVDSAAESRPALATASTLPQAAHAFETLLPPAGVLIVEDADDLDPASAGLVYDRLVKQSTPVLLVADFRFPHSGLVTELVTAAQPGETVTLAGLSFEDVAQFIASLLDGGTDTDTVARIATLSGGLPGLIQAIIRLGRRSGALVKRDGLWVSTTDLWDPALQFSLAPFLRGLEAADLEWLVRFASTEGHQEDALATDRCHQLAARGLLRFDRVSPDGGVQVYPAALAELLRQGEGVPPSRHHLAMSSIDLGRWPARLTGSEAATIAQNFRAHWQTSTAQYWAEWKAAPSGLTAVPLVMTLLYGAPDDPRILTVLDTPIPDDDVDSLTELAALAADFKAGCQKDLPGALADLDRHRLAHPETTLQVRGHEAHLRLLCDRVPPPELFELPAAGLQNCEMLVIARAEAAVAEGQIADALALLAVFEPQHQRPATLKRILESMALVLGDDIEAGVNLAVKQLWDSIATLDAYSISGHAYAAALGMCMLGRFDEIVAIVEILYGMGDTNVFQSTYRIGLFMLGAFVADWQGRADDAHALILQARSLGEGRGPSMLAQHRLLRHPTATTDQLWDDIDDLLDRGFVTAAVFLAVSVMSLSWDGTRAHRVIEQGQRSQSRVMRALTRYVEAVATGDLGRFAATVDELRAACGPLDATRSSVTWALLLRREGDLAGWVERADAAWAESLAIAGGGQGLFDRLADAVDLTSRETQVAHFVSLGLSSAEVSRRAGITSRTVEAHLQAIYRKTGVNSREDLRRITTTWLTLRLED